MICLIVVAAFIVAAALFAPLFGIDTRDGRDWKSNNPLFAAERGAAF